MPRPASTRSADPRPPAAAVRVERIGADGDGVASLPDGTRLYLPLTLPGETVLARPMARHGEGWLAQAERIEQPSADRIEPPCPHFGACGGCTLQHWRDEAYAAWKSDLLARALARAGYDPPSPVPLRRTPPGTRRRLDLAARRGAGRLVLGLHRTRAADIIDLRVCPVAHPALVALIAPLRAAMNSARMVRREASVAMTLLDDGPDLLLRTDAAPDAADRARITALAHAHRVSRISWARGNDTETEPLCTLRPSVATLSGTAVTPAPGGFLQASRPGEEAIIDAVRSALAPLPAKARVAELYAGCGTITFALAPRLRVAAFEGDRAAASALVRAVNGAGLSGRVTVEQRDLARRPVSGIELKPYAAVVLDPPYAGAPAQTAEIAASAVRRAVYVSCNPAALARDAGILRAAGFRLQSAVPIDQFLWSSRLESVVAFER